MKKFYILFVVSIFSLVLGIILGRYSESFRGIYPLLYAIGRLSGCFFIITSVFVSLTTSINIYFTKKDKQPNIVWKILISFPLLLFISLFAIIFLKSIY